MRILFTTLMAASVLQCCRASETRSASEKSISDAPSANAYSWTCYMIKDFQRVSSGPRLSDTMNRRRVCIGNYNDNFNYVLFDDGEDRNDSELYFGTSAQSHLRTPSAKAYSVHVVQLSGGRNPAPSPLSYRPNDIFVDYDASNVTPNMSITEKTSNGDGLRFRLTLVPLEGTRDNEILLELRKRMEANSSGEDVAAADCGFDRAGNPYQVGDAIKLDGECNTVCLSDGIHTARCIGPGPILTPPAGNGCASSPQRCRM